MLSSLLDYDLPSHLIAQIPADPRDSARLLRLERATNRLSHHFVRDLPVLLRPDDLLIFNDTRVLRARLRGQRASGGKVEALLLKERAQNVWETMLKPSARLQIGEILRFERAGVTVAARVNARLDSTWEIAFFPENLLITTMKQDVREMLSLLGEVPLPPYIREGADEERYQTTFSRREVVRTSQGALDSAAAPTAGLHFTPQLLENLRARGVDYTFVTLAVGAGTFAPVKTSTLEEHTMHSEEFLIGEEAARKINEQKARGARVIAVGTTSVRTLESAANAEGEVQSGEANTQLFLKPGSPFRVVDGLITNFHLPRSTLLALVAAFIEAGLDPRDSGQTDRSRDMHCNVGFERVAHAYQQAIKENYRFFSFGDAMLLE